MEDPTYKPVSIGEWIVTGLLLCIPLVNIVLIFVWAFGSNTPISKANWAKAALIWMLFSFIFSIGMFVVMGLSAASFAASMP